jgi:hypothetical protein
VRFFHMLLCEQISGIAESRMVFCINFPMLDGFAYCILSDKEVAKILDRCGLGQIYKTLVVIKDRSWCICVLHFQVAEDAMEMLSHTSGFIN